MSYYFVFGRSADSPVCNEHVMASMDPAGCFRLPQGIDEFDPGDIRDKCAINVPSPS